MLADRDVALDGLDEVDFLVFQVLAERLDALDDGLGLLHELDVVLGALELEDLLGYLLVVEPFLLHFVDAGALVLEVLAEFLEEGGLAVLEEDDEVVEVLLCVFDFLLGVLLQG